MEFRGKHIYVMQSCERKASTLKFDESKGGSNTVSRSTGLGWSPPLKGSAKGGSGAFTTAALNRRSCERIISIRKWSYACGTAPARTYAKPCLWTTGLIRSSTWPVVSKPVFLAASRGGTAHYRVPYQPFAQPERSFS